MDTQRGTGLTTSQMKDAPQGAVYIWVNRDFRYPMSLAKAIGRYDLKIESPSWISGQRWRGLQLSGLVVDHAVRLTDDELENWQFAKERVVPHNAKVRGVSTDGLIAGLAGTGE